MSELKALKSALITSIVSVILCLAMLLGGTFAYFSSDVTGNVATIQTGYLSFNAFYDINNSTEQAMYTAETQLLFVNVADSTQTLWVAGESYVLPAIYFSNLGNIKCTVGYELKLSEVDVGLLGVIDFSVNVDGVVCNLPKSDGDSVTAAGLNGETVTVTLQIIGDGEKYTYVYNVNYDKVIDGQAGALTATTDVRMQVSASMHDVESVEYMDRTLASSIELKINASQLSSQP